MLKKFSCILTLTHGGTYTYLCLSDNFKHFANVLSIFGISFKLDKVEKNSTQICQRSHESTINNSQSPDGDGRLTCAFKIAPNCNFPWNINNSLTFAWRACFKSNLPLLTLIYAIFLKCNFQRSMPLHRATSIWLSLSFFLVLMLWQGFRGVFCGQIFESLEILSRKNIRKFITFSDKKN